MTSAVLLDEVRSKRPEISRGEPQDRDRFTGERFLPGYADGSIELQHMHRYSLALPFASGLNVIDVGCGEGYGCDLLAHVAHEVIGVDVDEEIIGVARNRYNRPNLGFKVGHASAIPAESHCADLIVSFETLEHLTDHESFWSEIKRVLKSTGVLIVSSPNRDVYNAERRNPNLFHKRELSQLEFVTEIARKFRFHSLFSQSTLLGSAITPLSSSSGSRTVFSVDPNTGVLQWRADNEVVQPFSIAIAADIDLPVSGESIYTGDYPANAMASLVGGIADRDRELRALKAALADRNGSGVPPPCSESFAARDSEVEMLKVTLAEQARTIRSLRALLDESTRQAVRSRNVKRPIATAGTESEQA